MFAGLVQQAGRRAVVNLHPAATTAGSGATAAPATSPAPLGAHPHPHQGRQVKVVRTLTAAQRNRLLQAAGTGALGLRELAGMLQLRPSTHGYAILLEPLLIYIINIKPLLLSIVKFCTLQVAPTPFTIATRIYAHLRPTFVSIHISNAI